MLRILKRSNANLKILLTVFTSIIRPVLEYACQVRHFNIQQYLSDEIEKIQKRALRIILAIASPTSRWVGIFRVKPFELSPPS
jgi:hypothetical protein